MMIFAATRLRYSALVLAAAIVALAAMSRAPVNAALPRPNGYPVTNVNLRAGPGTDFPVIVTVPNRAWISILGCLADYGWCDVLFEGNRGWMRSIYLAGWYQGYYYPLRDYAPQLGYPVVTFDIGGYWDAYYRSRPFYADRARWGGPRQEGWADRSAFYDRLAPYGQWTWLEGQYVFVPGDIDRSWRPYTVGRWVYTDRYGWMWASNEPFGWATYHYGRWGFSKRIGWFWVPGSRWAPAWVSWRQSDDYLAWAPLPPTSDEGVSVEVTARNVPNYYWQAVPSNQFLAEDLPRRIVRDQAQMKPVLERTQPLTNVTVNNTVVVNNAVTPQFVEEKTQEKVVVHKVERTQDAAKAGKVAGASVDIFQPAADQKPAVAPPKPKKIEEVAAESKTKEQAGAAPATDNLMLPPEIKTPEAVQATPPAPPPPPAPPANEATPAAGEAAPPPPPPPAEQAAPPPPPAPAEEAAPPPPPPPPPAEEAAPPPPVPAEEVAPKPHKKKAMPPAEETAPPSPPAEEAAPPAEEAAPKPHEKKAPPPEEAAPPPPPAEEAAPPLPPEAETPNAKQEGKAKKHEMAPPPPVEEAAPPPPPPPAEAETPKAEPEGKSKKHEEIPPPAEEAAPPSPPAEEAAPPPSLKEMAPPPPPPPAKEAAPPPPPPPAGEAAPPKQSGEPAPCPEGTVRLDDGGCAPPQQ